VSLESLLSAEPLLVPVGKLLSTYDGGRAWPGQRLGLVRIGRMPHELTEPEYRVWSLSHGVPETVLLRPWTARAVAEFASASGVADPGGTIAALIGRGLLAEISPGTAERVDFARRFRLVPQTVGLGNPEPEFPDMFVAGERADLAVAIDPAQWLVWRLAAADVDLLHTCVYVAAALEDHDWPGSAEIAAPGEDAVDLVHIIVNALHTLLAAGVVHLDERWARQPLPWEPVTAPRTSDDRSLAEIFAIGHSGGLIHGLPGKPDHQVVRIGRTEHELNAVEYRIWAATVTAQTTPGRAFTRWELSAALGVEGTAADRQIDALLLRGLLAEIGPRELREFAVTYRLRTLRVGLGYDRIGAYQIGRLIHQREQLFGATPLTVTSAREADVWQWCDDCINLWEIATLVAGMNEDRGSRVSTDVEPLHQLGVVHAAARTLLSRGAAYLDQGLPS
jgi:hypothetical protein